LVRSRKRDVTAVALATDCQVPQSPQRAASHLRAHSYSAENTSSRQSPAAAREILSVAAEPTWPGWTREGFHCCDRGAGIATASSAMVIRCTPCDARNNENRGCSHGNNSSTSDRQTGASHVLDVGIRRSLEAALSDLNSADRGRRRRLHRRPRGDR